MHPLEILHKHSRTQKKEATSNVTACSKPTNLKLVTPDQGKKMGAHWLQILHEN